MYKDDDPRIIVVGEEINALIDQTPNVTVSLEQREWAMALWMTRYATEVHAKRGEPEYALATNAVYVDLLKLLAAYRNSANPAHTMITVREETDLFFAAFATAVNIVATQDVIEEGPPGSIGRVAYSLIRNLGVQLPDGVARKTYERFGVEKRF